MKKAKEALREEQREPMECMDEHEEAETQHEINMTKLVNAGKDLETKIQLNVPPPSQPPQPQLSQPQAFSEEEFNKCLEDPEIAKHKELLKKFLEQISATSASAPRAPTVIKAPENVTAE